MIDFDPAIQSGVVTKAAAAHGHARGFKPDGKVPGGEYKFRCQGNCVQSFGVVMKRDLVTDFYFSAGAPDPL